jgi:CRP-like cAMP-binding protein
MTIGKNPSAAQLDLLRRIPGLRAGTDRELRAVACLVEDATAEPGSVLIEEGAGADQAYVIVEGWAAVTVHGEPVAALGPGQFVGEMALLDHGPRTASVVAKTPMRLLAVGPAAFDALLGAPDVAGAVARGLTSRLRTADAAGGPDAANAEEPS